MDINKIYSVLTYIWFFLFRGQTPAESELQYLENAKKLAMYGVHMHDAKVNSLYRVHMHDAKVIQCMKFIYYVWSGSIGVTTSGLWTGGVPGSSP